MERISEIKKTINNLPFMDYSKEALDKFLKTNAAKKYSLSNKNQLVRYLVIRFLEKYQKEYGLLVSEEILDSIKKSA
jgi:hypothetical protein